MDRAGDYYSEDLKELITTTTTANSNCATNSSLNVDGDSVPIFTYEDSESAFNPKVGHLRSFRKNGLMDHGANRHNVMKGNCYQRSEKDASAWAMVHELSGHGLHSFSEAAADMAFVTKNALALRDAHSNESMTAPFKSVQAPAIDQDVARAATKQQNGATVRNGTTSMFTYSNSSSNNNNITNTSSSRNAKTATTGTDQGVEQPDHVDDEKESAASFDFNRHRSGANVNVGVGTLITKPTPSKWDDAEKWLSAGEPKPKNSPLSIPTRIKADTHPTPEECHDVANGSDHDGESNHLVDNHDDHNVNSPDQKSTRFVTTKKSLLPRFAFMPKSVPVSRPATVPVDRYPLEDVFQGRDHHDKESSQLGLEMALSKAASRTAKPSAGLPVDSVVKGGVLDVDDGLSDQVDPPNMRTTVCMRDMGTEMTPMASVDPSRTATPLMATTPNLGSPAGSLPASPPNGRVIRTKDQTQNANAKVGGKASDYHHHHHHVLTLSGKEKTRAEILALGTQLGKANIAAWATKEEEEADAVQALKASLEMEEVRKNLLASRAAAWEEAEQAKYTARFKREEAKIQAWENHEKAKAEAEMRRVEVKVERMRSHANEKLMNKLAAARRRAGDLRAKAEAVRCEQAAKTASMSDHIRRTGKIPTSFFSHLCG